jgi:hypothetical protein
MSTWLDTETKALLQHVPPEKYAPPATGTFALVLLKKGNDLVRLAEAFTRIPPHLAPAKAADLVARSCPQPIAIGLSLGDALLGQFELVCCDSISVFLKAEVLLSATGAYLARLYSQVQSSSEFEDVIVRVTAIPDTDQGRRIVDQFLGSMKKVVGDASKGYSYTGAMMRKTARIMAHWAGKIGTEVTIAGDGPED